LIPDPLKQQAGPETVTGLQASLAVTDAAVGTATLHMFIEAFEGQLSNVGAVVSLIITVAVVVSVLPQVSLAVYVLV
jgi:hypothetical protein